MCTQLYDKEKKEIYPITTASCVSVTNDNFKSAQDAIDTLLGQIDGLIVDVEYLKEHGGGGGGTVVVQPSVNVTIHDFPSKLTGTINLFDYQNYFDTSSPYATFSYSNIENPTRYSVEITVYGNTTLDSGEIQAGEDTEIVIELPATITPGTKTVSVKVTIEGISGSASKSFTAKVPSMLIWSEGDSVTTLSIDNPTASELSLYDLTGQYTAPGNKYLWIVTTEKLKKFVVGNISANYETSTLSDTTYNINYNCYRALVKPDSGKTLNIEVG